MSPEAGTRSPHRRNVEVPSLRAGVRLILQQSQDFIDKKIINGKKIIKKKYGTYVDISY